MIKKFGFKNFASFKEGAEISFEFDGNTPSEISQGNDISSVLGIKGANGSGKTNVIRALAFLSRLCAWGFTETNNKPVKLPLDTFFQSKELSEFYIDFTSNGRDYYYELDIQEGKIVREAIWRKQRSKRKIIERIGNEITYSLKSLSEFSSIELQDQFSIIELVRRYKFKSDITDLESVHWFFIRMIINVDSNGYFEIGCDLSNESKGFLEDEILFSFAKELIKSSDSSIEDIEILKNINNDGDEVYFPVFIHVHNGKKHNVPFNKESSGTKKIYEVLSAYFLVLRDGGLLALDEFDIHFHAMVLPKIIELFTNSAINIKNAQFIFTSHNTEIIDNLGKYRTILVNKEDSESYCYRLDEIAGTMLRNDRPISPLYKEGKIGGVPTFFENNLAHIMEKVQNAEKL